jgi:hypothetical protein
MQESSLAELIPGLLKTFTNTDSDFSSVTGLLSVPETGGCIFSILVLLKLQYRTSVYFVFSAFLKGF